MSVLSERDSRIDLQMHSGSRPKGEPVVSISIDDTQGIIDRRNQLFPGWWTYSGENPDYSPYWLSIRNRFYPNWWASNTDLPTDLKPWYRVVCGDQETASVAIYTQPKTVRASIEILGARLEDLNWVELVKPPFARVELDHQHH